MKKIIWKFPLSEKGVQTFELRKGYEILTLQMQNGMPCIWVLLNPDEIILKETFEIYGTGHEIHYDHSVNREYVGTFQQDYFVWHLFKRIES